MSTAEACQAVITGCLDETGETSVQYKRRDGQFGLIEPTAVETEAQAS